MRRNGGGSARSVRTFATWFPTEKTRWGRQRYFLLKRREMPVPSGRCHEWQSQPPILGLAPTVLFSPRRSQKTSSLWAARSIREPQVPHTKKPESRWSRPFAAVCFRCSTGFASSRRVERRNEHPLLGRNTGAAECPTRQQSAHLARHLRAAWPRTGVISAGEPSARSQRERVVVTPPRSAGR